MSSSIRQRPSTISPTEPLPYATTTPPPPPPQTVLSQALQSSAQLANLLPTGTLLAFQLLAPMLTNSGSCDNATRPMTAVLLTILSLSCFLASFTDSIKGADNKVYYGFVTPKGLWLFDYQDASASGVLADLGKYRLSFIDVIHAFVSVLVFMGVALRDRNVVSCFYPMPGHEAQEVLDVVPIAIGLLSSLLFVVFPSSRNGIGYPVTHR